MAPRAESLLALYRTSVLPLLTAAGFEGTAAKCEKRVGRGRFIATTSVPRDAKDRTGELVVSFGGTDSVSHYLFVADRFRASPTRRAAVIKKLVADVRKAIKRIASLNVLPTVTAATSLADALRVVLEAFPRAKFKPRLPPLRIQRTTQKGRLVSVHCKGRKAPIVADRTALLSLARGLWGDRPLLACHDPRFEVSQHLGDELAEYIAQLRRVSADDARALYVHLFGPYGVEQDQLEGLFPKPLFAAKALNEAASGGALVKRAIPYARKGRLVDRVAALYQIHLALSDAWNHRDAETTHQTLRQLAAELSKERAPLLRECAWLLVPMVDWCESRRAALR